MEFNSLLSGSESVTVDWGGESVTLTYDPCRFTEAFVREMPEMLVTAALERFLVGWDVTEAGAPVPVSRVAELPLLVRQRLWNAIWESLSPNLKLPGD